MNKQIIVLIVALFGMIVPISPLTYASVAPAHAATTAQVLLGEMNTTYPYTFTAASFNVSGYSGSYILSYIDKKATTYYLDINLSQIAAAGWPAGEFNLTASTNGYLSGAPVGTVFAANIPVSEVKQTVHSHYGPLSGFYNYTYNGYTFHLGNNSVIAPIAYNVPGGSYYIKAVFGSSYIYASYAQEIILPGIKVSGVVHPNEGPAGSTITVKGSGFSANGLVNLTWTYYVLGKKVTQFMTFTANSLGAFTQTVTAPELKLETPASSPYPNPGTVTFVANDTETKTLSNTATWYELPRVFTEIAYYSPATAKWTKVPGAPFYNGTAPSVPFYETEPIKVTGNYFDPNSQVKLYFDGSLLATATTNGTGYFTVSANVPIAAAGTYTVNATDPLAYIYFSGKTVPEVVVTPNKVVPGQSITVNGYAYTKNSMVNATLLGLELDMYNVTILTNGMNVPTNSLGEWSFSTTLPMAIYGGVHYINATDLKGVSAYAKITVNPLIVLSPSKAPLGSNVTVNLYGLSVGTEYWPLLNVSTGGPFDYYGIAYDNILTYAAPTWGNMSGENSNLITAAGYPMLHAVQLVLWEYPYTLESTAWLNVTGTTNTEAQTTAAIKSLNTSVSSQLGSISSSISSDYSSLSSSLSSLSSSLSSMNTSVSSQLGSISSSLTSISKMISDLATSLSSDYSSLSSSLSSLSSSLSSMNTSVSSQLGSISSSISSMSGTMTTQYSSIMSSLTSISTMISDLKTSLSSDYSSLSSSLSSLSSSVSSISSTTSSVSTTVSSIGPSVSSLQSSVSSLESSVSSLMTYLLVVAVLAIIIIVLELILLVRKK